MDQLRNLNQNGIPSNRVYINRNFNRTVADGVTMSTSNVMYFNPNFSHKSNSQQITQQEDNIIRQRIYVNPNFIRPKVQDDPIAFNSQKNTVPVMSTSSMNQYTHTQPIQAIIANGNNSQRVTVSKSRYCLVRQNEKVSKTPSLTSLPIKITQQTVKVNKYKLISLNSVKKSLISDKKFPARLIQPTPMKLSSSNIIKSKYKIRSKPSLNIPNNRFRFVKKSLALLNSPETTQVRRMSLTPSKSLIKINNRQPKKVPAGAMKKNNIPCPLFKKYGKCLRMVRGSCDYLHDRKHVSICRKFLKGICHDKHCLLSHDLTDKKMPTCYFYLQGNCTKEGCPYLHVKLNEKTKICPDFLRGYCEKGDKCVHRHVNVSFDSNHTSNKIKKHNCYINTNKHFPERKKINRKKSEKQEDKPSKVDAQNIIEIDNAKDQRYFKEIKDNATTEDQYDLIKPTRCKLGILPSFIQL